MIHEAAYIPGEGGVRIAADAWAPGAGRSPTVLVQHRYWRGADMRWPFGRGGPRPGAAAARMLAAGYSVVDIDVRGAGASFGARPDEWPPEEAGDAVAVLDWIVSRPWSDGRVAAVGISYGGTAALLLAARGHPALRAVAARFCFWDLADDLVLPGGVRNTWLGERWAARVAVLDRGRLPIGGLRARLAVRGPRAVAGDRRGLREALAGRGDGPTDHSRSATADQLRARAPARGGRTPGRHPDPAGARGRRAVTAARSLRRRLAVSLAGFGGLALTSIVLGPLVGSTSISLRRAFDVSIPFADNVDAQIFFVARLPRALAGALVGGTLAAAGVVFQGLLRNPLATPFTLGVSAGAALGAMLAITFGWRSAALGLPAVPVASFAGALGAVAIVYVLARARQRGLSTNMLLLAGVTLNAFFSALILFVQYFRDFADTYPHAALADGRPRRRALPPLVAALPLLVVAFALFAWLARAAEPAQPRRRQRRDARRQRRARAARRLLQRLARDRRRRVGRRPDRLRRHHRPAPGPAGGRRRSPGRAAGVGALRRGVSRRRATSLSRTLLAPVELPVGIITALIGGPFFLWLLVRGDA